MAIDLARALGARPPAFESYWGADDVILYHLGLGAAHQSSTEASELCYVYEENLAILPSFAVTPMAPALLDINNIEGLDVDLGLVVHGEQDLELHRNLPREGKISSMLRVASIEEKGSGALIVLEIVSCDELGALFTNRVGIFARGEGGFAGSNSVNRANIKSTSSSPPDRTADEISYSPTSPAQALIYRLSGDKNPLHADPAYAAAAGFDKPILQGLCTYGIALKAVVDNLLDGDVSRIRRYKTRFSGIVFPGETLVTSMWREGDIIHLSASTLERGERVLSSAKVWV